ncbi:DUF551 domain-containing protein, partial [Stenotrophomonas maltophilia group sp. RNC7]|uniref:DUF551 domain-containing protein n=1 Tax=Stenotrophomonas maltophilia group sp. RNC7 TaxID=3071467 RepID=UPI0027E07A26
NKDECSAEYLSYLLIQHIWKGDPVDIANLAMMLQQRGDRIVIDSETSFIIPDHPDAGKVEGDGWLPIESAPKDGTPVLIAWQAVTSVRGEKQWFQTVAHYDDSFEIAGYDEETGDAHKRGAWTDGAVASWAYEEIREISPTHWRPLPSAPSQEAAGS